MAEWLRTLIFSALARRLTAVGSSPTRITCETSQVLLVSGQQVVFFWGIFRFRRHLTIDSAQNE